MIFKRRQKVIKTLLKHHKNQIFLQKFILMQNLEFFVYYFCKNTFCHSVLPSNLNFADVTPVYKKNSKSSKENYPPISILSNVSIVYDRCLYDQMQNYFQFSYHFSIQEMYVFSSVLKTPCLKKNLSIKML